MQLAIITRKYYLEDKIRLIIMIVYSISRCTDYIFVNHDRFGVSESCGTEPADNSLQLGDGEIVFYATCTFHEYVYGHKIVLKLLTISDG